MCCDSSAEKLQKNLSMNHKTASSKNPARKTRTKTRKPKYASLRRDLSPESSESGQMAQLNLFPLHPENLFEEKLEAHDHVDYFFDQGAATSTLDAILGDGGEEEEVSRSPPLTCSYGVGGDEDGRLEQAALRRQRERDVSEEKWVAYSEVVEREQTEECYRAQTEESYCAQGLQLKLDYEEILNAWSGKGPLYIEGESPQVVPDLTKDSSPDYFYFDGGSMGKNEKQVWTVPEDGSCVTEDSGEGKISNREARVMRYKEKRQSRLFSKRIRYEVRKINAEKRPRIKGRFVKRKSED